MGFDLIWLLLGLPIAFALGWLGSRLDLRQWRREQQKAPKAYFKGLNLLLNEQHDKAIDAFIQAVQHDPDTTDLHFALGNLFRRRGEYERAVRVHEHLLRRADLPPAERERAQHALAQDFVKAGLFDRAEQAYHQLEGSSFDTEARLALLTLHERSRHWHEAISVAQKLENTGTASFANRIAHYWCEIALDADAHQQTTEGDNAIARAKAAAPSAARHWVLAGQRARQNDQHALALQLWSELFSTQPASFNLVAREYAQSARECGQHKQALAHLRDAYRRTPTLDLSAAITVLHIHPQQDTQEAVLRTPSPSLEQGSAAGAYHFEPDIDRQRVLQHLQQYPSLSAAQELLRSAAAQQSTLSTLETQTLSEAIARAAKPLQRYRCAACGFEAQHYFWQCPGCSNWDSYPPQRLEDL
jgi:lipopolysaccharide assembly protein B